MDSMFIYHFVDPDPRLEITFRKEGAVENGGIDFEIVDMDILAHEVMPFFSSTSGTKHNMDF